MARTQELTESHSDLATRLADARARTDEIFALLTPDALYQRPIAERHRLIFYLGHLEAFDWNLVARQGYGLDPFEERFDRLFAFGIDPVGGCLPNEPASDWPQVDTILAYNRRVRETVDECLAGRKPKRSDETEDTLFQMAIEHRLMHAETLAYLLHQLPYESKRGGTNGPAVGEVTVREGVAEIPAGTATLGRLRADGGFGWDNEFERSIVQVPSFAIDLHKITNREFLAFVDDRGYERREFWSDADWNWKERDGMRHPALWSRRDDVWHYRGMFEEKPLAGTAPVYVSHAEAAAYARWAKRSLPTEPQYHRAAYGTPSGEERAFPWGDDAPGGRLGNFDMRYWDPTPLGAFTEGDSAFGVSELIGNGWEWTSSIFGPFPGFHPHPYYRGYSADFFDGSHFVMKGGSPRTAACMLRRSFRNWFQPHYPYVYATFRLVTP